MSRGSLTTGVSPGIGEDPHPDIRSSLLFQEGSYTPIGTPVVSTGPRHNNHDDDSDASPALDQSVGMHGHIAAEALVAPPESPDAPTTDYLSSPISAGNLHMQSISPDFLELSHEASAISSHRLMQNYSPTMSLSQMMHFPHIASERLHAAPAGTPPPSALFSSIASERLHAASSASGPLPPVMSDTPISSERLTSAPQSQSPLPYHMTIASERILAAPQAQSMQAQSPQQHPVISSERLRAAPQPRSSPGFPGIASESLRNQPRSLQVREGLSPHPHIGSGALLSRSGSPRPASPRSPSSPFSPEVLAPSPQGSPAYSRDVSPDRTTVPGSMRTVHFDAADSVVSLGDFSPGVNRAISSLQNTFQYDDAQGNTAGLDRTMLPSSYQPSSAPPSPYQPSSPLPDPYQPSSPPRPAPYLPHVPEDADYLTQALAQTASMQHSRRIDRYERGIHAKASFWHGSEKLFYIEGESSEHQPPPMLPAAQQVKNEEAFFSELRTQLYHADHELDKYRGLLEHAMSSALEAKTMLPPGSGQSPQAWQPGFASRVVSPQNLVGVRGRVMSNLAPVLEQVDGMTGYGEALARRKKHMEGQLKASRAVLSASMEKEALKQAKKLKMDQDSWEGANNMLNSLVAILLPHLSQLEAIPADRRSPSESTAIHVLTAAANC